MGSKLGLHCLLGAVALTALARVAGADVAATAAPIAIESYEGERPADAETLLRPIYTELARRGFVVGDALVAQIERTESRSADQLSASASVEAQRYVDQGYQSFVDGDYAAAVASVTRALELYATAPGQMGRESALRDLQFRALLVAARSYEVLGQGEEAFGTMAEAIRTFPDRHVSGAEFGPQVNALYRRVRDALAKQGTGSLEIKVDDPAAVLFVNERFVGTGAVKLDQLVPGPYRVYVAKGGQPGRLHAVQVNAGAPSVVSLSWDIDGALRTRAGYAGLEFARGGGTDQEIALATRLARELGARRVVILGVRQLDRHRAVVGWSISTESQTKVFGGVQIEPVDPAPETLAKLGALLGGDKNVDTRDLITTPPRPRVAREAAALAGPPGRPFKVLKWLTAGAGVAVLGTGGVFIAIDEDDPPVDPSHPRAEKHLETLKPGIGMAVGGAVLLGIGVYMFIADAGGSGGAEEERGPAFSIAPTDGGLSFAVSGHF